MEEKKLTDEANRFLLDLRCCIYHNCAFCSQWNNGFEEDDCREEMLNRAKNFIHRLQDESAKQKAEIERLTEENFVLYRDRFTKKELDDIADFRVKKATAELQKQVDELKERLIGEKLHIECKAPAIKDCPIAKQAVKDTAKEILDELLDIEVKDEDYKMFFLDVCDKLEKLAQKYGVEVE